ncbi:hypothetical protein [Azospirillum sp. B2RO_4]|uniref:hypothetical protein n=1 Tax=Azospirillum sp. B2RO_4 TaxID=3027796 RepID=UPI003DA9E6CE
MSNHPNRAHTEAPAMSFEQQVAQVLDSLTKELTVSEPPTGPLDAANEYAAPPRHASSLATTVIPALGLTFREAADRARDLLTRAAASHERDEDDEGPAAAERLGWQGEANRLHDAILAAAPVTVADLSVKLERLTCPIFGVGVFVHPNHLQNLAEDVRRMVAAVLDYRGMPTTTIPELGITFAEAAERYRSLRRAEMEANQRGDQGAADDTNRRHCQLADQIMDAAPVTPADAIVILGMLADREMGVAAGIDDERAQRALERVYALLSVARQPQGQSEEGELSAMVCRWLELRDVADPSEDEAAELDRLFDRIAAYQPHTAADALALLVFVLTCYMGDSIIELQNDGSGYARALQKGLAHFASAGDSAAGTLYRLGPIGLIDERAFWVDPEANGTIARHGHREAEAFPGKADDDVELLDLWRRYLPLKAEAERINEATANGDPEAWERAHKPCDELEDRMAVIPARTPTGIAVKLAVLWQWGGAYVEGGKGGNERENGPSYLSDFMTRWLWMIMNEARALGASMPLLPNDATMDTAAAAAESRRLVLEIESEAPVDPVADAAAEGAEEEELPVVDRTGSGLSKAEVRFMNVLDRMGPDDKEGLILTGEAMIALGDAMKAAQKAAAIDRRWSEFFAKLLREDAAKLHPEGDNGLVAANGDSATADPFSDAVEDIGAQASATLSMPLEMTDRMVDAGASAAGITPEQFKAAVQAAREARAA